MQTCICDKCSNEIEICVEERVIDKDTNDEDITEQFFICPECGRNYTIFISDSFMRRKIASVKKLKRKPMQNPVLVTALQNEMQNHFKKLKVKYNRE